jgi:hypothetical protein
MIRDHETEVVSVLQVLPAVTGRILPMLAGREKIVSFVEDAFNEMESETEEGIVGAVMLVVEVKVTETDSTAFYMHCTDRRAWIQRAMLDEARVAAGIMDS